MVAWIVSYISTVLTILPNIAKKIEWNGNGLRRARVFRERENPLSSLNDGKFFKDFE